MTGIKTDIRIERDNAVATLVFSNSKGNSLDSNALRSISEHVKKLSRDCDLKLLRLRSEGASAFCAGASFDELLALTDRAEAEKYFQGFGILLEAILHVPVPVIAQVQGKTVGGGVGLIAACDYVIASPEASLRLSEISIGIGPFVIAPIVERKIGRAHFLAMTLDREWRDARWCLEQGLFSQISSSADNLAAETEKFCKELASCEIEALKYIKAYSRGDIQSSGYDYEALASLSAELSLLPGTKASLKRFSR